MKKFICILLMLLFALPVLAEGAPLAEERIPFEWPGYVLHIPEGVDTEENEGSVTFVSGTARVVAIFIDRVPDENPAEAIIRMMTQFDSAAIIGTDVPMAEGFVGLEALAEDKLGEGVDQLTVMILSGEGELLILSGYDLTGDEDAARALLDEVMACVKVHGEQIVLTDE